MQWIWVFIKKLHCKFDGSKKKLQGKLDNIWKQLKIKRNIPKLKGYSKGGAQKKIYNRKSLC